MDGRSEFINVPMSEIQGEAALRVASSDNAREVERAVLGPKYGLKFEHLPSFLLKPPPAREWLIKDWIPIGGVTGLYADGGVGKSLLSQQLMTCVATARPWLGHEIGAVGPALGFFCEDDSDELRRRQACINAALGLKPSDLNLMSWVSRTGEDNILFEFSGETKGNPTQTYHNLYRYVIESKAKLLIVDTLADTFGGNENNRSHVRQYVNGLNRAAQVGRCAVVLCAHPSQSGMSEGAGGSTAWSNTFRVRTNLTYAPKDELDELISKKKKKASLAEKSSNDRVLYIRKSNYAPLGRSISMTLKDGVFLASEEIAKDPQIVRKKMKDEQDALNFILARIKYCAGQGVYFSDKGKGGKYGPKIWAREAKLPEASLKAAMNTLLKRGTIQMAEVGRTQYRNAMYGLVIVQKPAAGAVAVGEKPVAEAIEEEPLITEDADPLESKGDQKAN